MQAAHDRCAKLKIGIAVHEHPGALLHGAQTGAQRAGDGGIVLPSGLDVHRHIIGEPFIENGAEHGGVRAVRIELHGEAERFDLPQKIRQIALQRRLAAGDGNAVEQALYARGRFTMMLDGDNVRMGLNKNLGFGENSDSYENMREKQMDALKKAMRPEFINRIDDIVIFRALEKDDMKKIASLIVDNLIGRLAKNGYKLSVSDAAKDMVIEKGSDAQYGARPLRRAVQRMIEDELSERILKGEFAIGDEIDVDRDGDKLTFAKKV